MGSWVMGQEAPPHGPAYKRGNMNQEEIAVVVTAVGETMPGYSRYTMPFVYEYCRRNNYRLMYLDLPPAEVKRNPSWQKLLVYHILPESVNMAVLIDMDVVPMPWADPIHEVLQPDAVNCVLLKDVHQCGVLGLPRSQRQWAEDIYATDEWERQGGWYEQKPVNQSLHSHEAPVHLLDKSWNVIPGRRFRVRDVKGWPCNFLHCAGQQRNNRKFSRLKQVYRQYVSQCWPSAVGS